MALADDIAAIRNNGFKSDTQKRKEIYALKVASLVDVINNGKPAPNPIPPLIGREFTLDGVTVTVHHASSRFLNGVETLYVDMRVNGQNREVFITNPPVLPKNITGDEKQDLIQCASEMLATLV